MSKKNHHLLFGRKGEDIATQFLVDKGYKILVRNHRYKRCEIDLIVQNDKLLVFVEVKTRSGRAFGAPEEFVSPAQAERIMEAAESYMHSIDMSTLLVRFDIIAIEQKGKEYLISHFEDALS